LVFAVERVNERVCLLVCVNNKVVSVESHLIVQSHQDCRGSN
jgi:hypothetical protein